MARRILTDFVIDKIAAVDRPCQEGATVAILKRAPDGKSAVASLMEELASTIRKASSDSASRRIAKLKIVALKAKTDEMLEKIGWTDEARAAAAAARAAKFHRGSSG